MRIAFKSTNTIHKLTKPKANSIIHEHMKSWIYKFTCATHKGSYIGQSSYSQKQRYQDHMRFIKQNDSQSAYTVHSLDNNCEYEPITTTMSILKQVTMPVLLIPYEPFYIQSYCNHKKTHTRTKCRQKQPNVPTDLCPSYYVTPVMQFRSILRLPRSQYQAHSPNHKTSSTAGMYYKYSYCSSL